jgi:hypothetical protein
VVLGTVVVVAAQQPVSLVSPVLTLGHGTAAAALRVELPTDGTGVVKLAGSNGGNVIGDVNIANGSTTVTEAPTIAAGQTSVALTSSVLFGFDGSTDSRITAAGTTPASNAVGLTVRPLMPTDGTNTAILDPCESIAQTSTPISMTSATTTRIVAPASSKKTYVCGLTISTGLANNVAVVEGTGGTCGTGTAGVIGGTTAANGFNFAANGGFVMPAGKIAHAITAGTNVDLCLITSSAGPLAGVVKWVQK